MVSKRIVATIALAIACASPMATRQPSLASASGKATPYYAVTKEMLAAWRALKDADHWYYRLQRDVADRTGTANERYADRGLSAGWMYLITQDPSYAAKAWLKWKQVWGAKATVDKVDMNSVTDQFAEGVILGSWLYETLSAADRQTMLATLSVWADWCLEIGTAPYEGGIRFQDSDLTTGQYFGLALLDLWKVAENRRFGKLLNQSTQRFGRPVGGLVATSADTSSTARNAIRAYVERLGASGEWIESSEYNPLTLKLLLLGYQALRVAGHGAEFPEIAAFVQKAARFYTHAWTAGWQTVDQWADDENPRDTKRMVYAAWSTMAMLAGLAGPTPEGKQCQWAVEQLAATRRDVLEWNGAFNIRAILSPWNPTLAGSAVDYTTPVAVGGAQGTGHYGVKRNDASLWFFGPNRGTFVDHQSAAYASFKLWRGGEWVVNHPVGYGAQAKSSSGVNAVQLAGLNAMDQAGVTRVESGSDWWSMTYDTQGRFYDASFHRPPPPFVRRATRRMVYFRDSGGWDVIVVRDDIDAANPQALPDFARYEQAQQSAIKAAIARTGGSTKELIFWMPTGAPTQSTRFTQWTTAGGKTVRLVHLLPASFRRSVTPGTTALGSDYQDSERSSHFQLRVWPATATTTDVLLTVVLVGTGTPPKASVLDTTNAQVGGRQVRFGETAVRVSCPGGGC
jgi:hypothetical protein